jgi:hypothetical protein
MKTVEITRHKNPTANASSWQVAREIFAREGIRGINKVTFVTPLTVWMDNHLIKSIVERE